MKKTILTTLLLQFFTSCMGIGVLLGNLFDQTGNMFYAPAFTALVGGSVYMILVAKFRVLEPLPLSAFHGPLFLGTKHGAGSFLPGIILWPPADGVAHLGKYRTNKNFLFFPYFRL